jgi:hypothetical protein
MPCGFCTYRSASAPDNTPDARTAFVTNSDTTNSTVSATGASSHPQSFSPTSLRAQYAAFGKATNDR